MSLADDHPQTNSSPPAPAVGITVTSLEIYREPGPKLIEGLSKGIFLGGPAATTLTLFVNVPDKVLIGFDVDASELTHFTDNRGTDLSKTADGSAYTGLSAQPTIAPDRHRAVTWIRSAFLPAAGATKISAKGTVAVVCGSDPKTFRQEAVSLKMGAKVKLGSVEMEVESVGPPSAGDATMWIVFKSPSAFHALKSLRFMTASGKTIKSKNTGGASRQSGNTGQYSTFYLVDEKVPSVTLEAEVWGVVETLRVPINFDIGLGLDTAGPDKP